jgi:hypothetical protein
MESELAKKAERESIEANHRLKPEQRLNALLSHSRLMAQLRKAGQALAARKSASHK